MTDATPSEGEDTDLDESEDPFENESLNGLEYLGILGPLALMYLITCLYLL